MGTSWLTISQRAHMLRGKDANCSARRSVSSADWQTGCVMAWLAVLCAVPIADPAYWISSTHRSKGPRRPSRRSAIIIMTRPRLSDETRLELQGFDAWDVLWHVELYASRLLKLNVIYYAISISWSSFSDFCRLSEGLPASQTSSSAVAKRPRGASCPSVVSFNSTKRRAQSFIVSYTGYRFITA